MLKTTTRFGRQALLGMAALIWAAVVTLHGQGGAGAPALQGATATTTAEYWRDIQPIFAAGCVSCHSGATAPGELRLDTPEGLMKGGTSGPVVVPGDPARSLLTIRIEDRGNNRMPPGGQVTAAEIASIRAWIAQGATFELSVDFATQIQPLLRTHCYSCHSGSEPRNDFALDDKERALLGGTGGRAIVPGDPEHSALIARARGNGVPRMPMVGPPLPSEQVALLERWIRQGASWPDSGSRVHWAYVPPVRPAVPTVKDPSRIRTPVDNFVLARLEKEELSPSHEASPETLVRRLYLDLIGLPPSPREIDEALADTAPGAYERLVDKLLASPHYGERMATPWLDQARYGDSNGYERDFQRVAWP